MKQITLATLPTATEQEVFDYVAHHLLTQNQRSVDPKSKRCAYRGKDNLTCAAGCLMADDEYNPEFEGWPWSSLIGRDCVPRTHRDLIGYLQSVHDNNHPDNWAQCLKKVAKEFSLKFNQG